MNTKRHILSVLALSCAGLLAQQAPGSADPFVRKGPEPVDVQDREQDVDGPKQISLCFETFSLESADAADLLRAGLEGKALYQKVLQKLEKKEVTQECLIVVKARSGERAVVEGISEQIYPTEYEPPYIPPSAAAAPAPPVNGAPAVTPQPQPKPEGRIPGGSFPACPTSFETRNVGWSLEVEPTIASNNKVIDLRFAPNYTARAGDSTSGQGLSQTEMPVFETQRVATALTINANTPFFIGTLNRPPAAQIDPATAKRVWFAFITPTIVTADCTVQH